MKTDNEIIAEFMGLVRKEANESYNKAQYWLPKEDRRYKGQFVGYYDTLKYHEFWDWLMPVVQKIYSMYDEFDFQSIKDENRFLDVLDNPVKYPISDTYRKVVDLIKWLNDSVLIEREKDMKT